MEIKKSRKNGEMKKNMLTDSLPLRFFDSNQMQNPSRAIQRMDEQYKLDLCVCDQKPNKTMNKKKIKEKKWQWTSLNAINEHQLVYEFCDKGIEGNFNIFALMFTLKSIHFSQFGFYYYFVLNVK